MMDRFDAVVAGHICLDLTPVFSAKRALPIEEILVPGKLTLMEGLEVSPGGAVANTGLALSRLGYKTALVAKCGDDALANLLQEALESRDGRARLIRAAGERTSYSAILSPPGTDRVLLHDPGANDSFNSSDIDGAILHGARVFHLGYPPVMAALYRDGGRELELLLKKVHSAGVSVSLDMALPDPDSEAGRVAWPELLKRVAPYVDLFLPSLEELAFMVDRPLFDTLVQRAGHTDVVDSVSPEELRNLGETLAAFAIPVTGIKFGHRGFYLRTGTGKRMARLCDRLELDPTDWEERELLSESFLLDRVASSTGAGDTSIAGFLCALLERRSPEAAVTLACAVGAQVCTAVDAQSGIGTLEEIDRAVSDGWNRNRSEVFARLFRRNPEDTLWVGPADARSA